MIEDSAEARRLVAQIAQAAIEIAIANHGPIPVNPVSMSISEAKRVERWRVRGDRPPVPHAGRHHTHAAGSRLPASDPTRRDDREPDHRQKSQHYFASRLTWWERDEYRMYGVPELEELRDEAVLAREDWRRRPLVNGKAPAKADPEWKRFIAESEKPSGDLAKEYGVSRQYINKIRAMDWSASDENAAEETSRLRAEWLRRRAFPERSAV